MSDKTEEQIAKERDAVEAMRNAKANMTAALDRISTLEFALRAAVAALSRCKGYVGASSYTYPASGDRVTCHVEIDRALAEAQAKLGVSA
jgi:hypothetical protein